MGIFTYGKDRQRTISFPVGGIGSGGIGIAGNGGLIDWQIFNRPAAGTRNGYSHFAVKAQDENGLLDARVLVSDLQKPYMGEVDKRTMLGLPHFRELIFEGKYPAAELSFPDDRFPGDVKVRYYNPLIPLKEDDSSIPAVFVDITLHNNTGRRIIYTAAGAVTNPNLAEITSNCYGEDSAVKGLFFGTGQKRPMGSESSAGLQKAAPDRAAADLVKGADYGDFTLATDADDVSYQECWFRGNWNDDVETYWREFSADVPLQNRSYPEGKKGHKDTGMLCAHAACEPGETAVLHFVMTWNYPNNYNYWSGLDISTSNIPYDRCDRTPWKNYYAVLFEDSWESAAYALRERERLDRETRQFMDAIYSSSIPEEALEAVTANLAILSTPTCLRLEDGSFYGWEGCFDKVGSCEGTCTHVWNYEYVLPFLFPKLERSIRDLEYKYSQYEDGGMEFRLRLPLGSSGKRFHSCADGQLGDVIRTYMDYLVSGDRKWLAQKWDSVKKAVSYAWSEGNEDAWDRNKRGYMDGRQHHTLDMELFGPNAWLTGFYVGALEAACRMAQVLEDRGAEEEFRGLMVRGREFLNEDLFNGEYFSQKINIHDREAVARFDAAESYWNDEKQQIKYQIADGCGIDQLLAQWHGNYCGITDIFDKDKVHSALKAIYKYNFKEALGDSYNPWRLFAVGDESGTIMCEWPEGAERPAIPLTYAQECMDGMQYQAAGHMIREGMLEEGERIVQAVRAKYRGDNRNPWCEIECGSYYARSMASYSLLLSYSGFGCDMDRGHISFAPVKFTGDGSFRSFWSVEAGWGTVEYGRQEGDTELEEKEVREVRFSVLAGTVGLSEFSYGIGGTAESVWIDEKAVPFEQGDGKVCFAGKVPVGRLLKVCMN